MKLTSINQETQIEPKPGIFRKWSNRKRRLSLLKAVEKQRVGDT